MQSTDKKDLKVRTVKDQGANVENNQKAQDDALNAIEKTFATTSFVFGGGQYILREVFEGTRMPLYVPVGLLCGGHTMMSLPRCSFVRSYELREIVTGEVIGSRSTGMYMTIPFTIRTHIQERVSVDWSMVQGVYQKLALAHPRGVIEALRKRPHEGPLDFGPESHFAEVYKALRSRLRWVVDYQRDPLTSRAFRIIMGQRRLMGLPHRTSSALRPTEYTFDPSDGAAFVLEPLHTRNNAEVREFFTDVGQTLYERLQKEGPCPLPILEKTSKPKPFVQTMLFEGLDEE